MRKTLSQLIEQNYPIAEEPKDKTAIYFDNFGLRPFTGLRINELPKPKAEEQGGGYDWEHLYTDLQLSVQQLGLDK